MSEGQDLKSITKYESVLVTGSLPDATAMINSRLATGWFLKIDHPEVIVTERVVYLLAVLYKEPSQK